MIYFWIVFWNFFLNYMGKNLIVRIFDCWIICLYFWLLIVIMKFFKIYYLYIDIIYKYILNIYIYNCVSFLYFIVVLFIILCYYICINIELVFYDVIVLVLNYCMIKFLFCDIGLYDVEFDYNFWIICIIVWKNFKVMICGVYKILCIFIIVYIVFWF